jgi:hypothetical protein
MTFSVSEFRSNLVGDGARPNLFSVSLVFPAITLNGQAAGQKTTFMAKAAQLPGSSIGTVTQQYFGRELKFAGNRTFADWTLQIVNDEDFSIRNALESWMNGINSHAGNLRNSSALSLTNYSVDAIVTQYGKTGNTLKTYKFVGLFPVDIAPIDLNWGSNDEIEEFSATFSYQWWESLPITS